MAQGQRDIMAQAVYLAQIQAAKGKCQSNVCKILRKGSDNAAAAFIAEPQGVAEGLPDPGALLAAASLEEE